MSSYPDDISGIFVSFLGSGWRRHPHRRRLWNGFIMSLWCKINGIIKWKFYYLSSFLRDSVPTSSPQKLPWELEWKWTLCIHIFISKASPETGILDKLYILNGQLRTYRNTLRCPKSPLDLSPTPKWRSEWIIVSWMAMVTCRINFMVSSSPWFDGLR